jgi:cytochrome c553
MPAMRVTFIHAVALLLPLAVGTSAFAADPIEAKAKVCTTCHGENGVPQLKTTPVIWGQNAGYMFLQLRDFQSGARKNELMSPIAATLSRDDLLPLAEYFSKLKWPNLAQPEAPQDVAGKAQAGISSVGCIGCHLDHFQGDGTTARLAGQQHDYLLKTMTDFRSRTRGNNPGMSDLMNATSPDAIAALAQYLAGMQIDQYLAGQGH